MSDKIMWTHWDLNPGPSACEADVIPLHHVPVATLAAGARIEAIPVVALHSCVWALGVITYVLLTGTAPFMGRTKDEIYNQINHHEPKWERLSNASE